jgi:hypothetical protein
MNWIFSKRLPVLKGNFSLSQRLLLNTGLSIHADCHNITELLLKVALNTYSLWTDTSMKNGGVRPVLSVLKGNFSLSQRLLLNTGLSIHVCNVQLSNMVLIVLV